MFPSVGTELEGETGHQIKENGLINKDIPAGRWIRAGEREGEEEEKQRKDAPSQEPRTQEPVKERFLRFPDRLVLDTFDFGKNKEKKK